MERFIGIMSGTSLDGIDCVLCTLNAEGLPQVEAHYSQPFPSELQNQLRALCQPGDNEIEQLGRLDRWLGSEYASAVNALLKKTRRKPEDITAIGCHGQTIRHRPPSETHHPDQAFTLQIGDANTLASQTGIPVVADFRRRDIAEGGQGAPLAPALHQALFAKTGTCRAVVNIGGMANITWLDGNDAALGFDTGPGNVLMDTWVQQAFDQPFDDKGQIAARGSVIPELLTKLLNHPYFQYQAGPRSTGREDFDAGELQWALASLASQPCAEDVQATLLELTAQTISDSLSRLPKMPSQLFVCGGGAFNTALMQRLETLIHPTLVASTESLGLHPLHVEAVAFAWLAWRRLNALSGNLPSVTGASKEVVLGALYSA
ncbi:anhydro-N-acetylmuramic acid kinase [Litorivivens lipolytica]|uniref:Anhydro-N-acetylmuramic acid kinase n=1 Tax=Litorivivens lipolytica TaxID=1524264 RepID=A0A7W4W650_9GAMM|nr:anhydro-N-acetylmuramic acid kinase [Litorivivens lipolytica]MBB3048171.1 anhydro-N-acetylmuramic acid kinase [Litorivivens lipolytica]